MGNPPLLILNYEFNFSDEFSHLPLIFLNQSITSPVLPFPREKEGCASSGRVTNYIERE